MTECVHYRGLPTLGRTGGAQWCHSLYLCISGRFLKCEKDVLEILALMTLSATSTVRRNIGSRSKERQFNHIQCVDFFNYFQTHF